MAASSTGSSSSPSTSKGKGKQKAVDSGSNVAVARIPPMPNPSAGSANPSASLASLWNYLEPALDHIVRSPTNNPDRAPAIDVAYHMGIHTAVYNYFTSVGRFGVDALAAAPRQMSTKGLGGGGSGSAVGVLTNGSSGGGGGGDGARSSATPPGNSHGADLYEKLDKYYSEVCQELLASAPVDDSSLLPYLLPCYKRYHAGAGAVHRLLNYVNRHYVKRAVEEDKGWLRLTDILDAVVQAIEENQPREQLAARLRERRLAELKRWGYVEGASAAGSGSGSAPSASEDLARAEAAAEAASPPDRVVPLSSMAHRRFREDVVKPLLAVPKGKKGKKKYKKPPPPNAPASALAVSSSLDGENSGPKSRLARAVKELIESRDSETLEGRREMAAELNDLLGAVGIPVDHVLRKKLDKFLLRPKG